MREGVVRATERKGRSAGVQAERRMRKLDMGFIFRICCIMKASGKKPGRVLSWEKSDDRSFNASNSSTVA